MAAFLNPRDAYELFDTNQKYSNEVTCRRSFLNTDSAVTFRRLTTLCMTPSHMAVMFTLDG